MLLVQKFGGTSVAGVAAVRRVAGILADTVRSGASVAAVLSAQGDTTDELLSTAAQYNPNPSPRELDMLLSTGEQASVALMAMALEDMGLPVVSLTGWQAGMGTDAAHGAARLRRLSPGRVQRELEAGRIVLIAGFQGLSPKGDITTLGRGGSDTTAVAVAAALGAQVLHERAVELAARFNLPLEVRSSFTDAPGTAVKPLPLPAAEGRLTAVTEHGGLVTLAGTHIRAVDPAPGPRARRALEAAGIGVRSYLETDGRLTLQTDPDRGDEALALLHREFLEP